MSENSYFYSVMFNTTWVYFKYKLRKNATENIAEYTIPTKKNHSDYQTRLTGKLLERVYDFCKKNNIKLIIIDIPQLDGGNKVKTSFLAPTINTVMQNSDMYLTTDMLLTDYNMWRKYTFRTASDIFPSLRILYMALLLPNQF